MATEAAGGPPGPPPLRPFGLVLHRDGRFTHEGQPLRNVKLRALFERSVVFLPDEGENGKFVVRVGRFRGELEVEEAAFFVRAIDLEDGGLHLSDGSQERLAPDTLTWSASDTDVLLCRVKPALRAGGLLARFSHTAQAELFLGAELRGNSVVVPVAGEDVVLPAPIESS